MEASVEDAVWALGLMSGTSLDGVDAALLKTDGVAIEAFGPGAERPYREGQMRLVEDVMRAPPNYRPPATAELAAALAEASTDVDAAHAAAVAALLAVAAHSPAYIGYHGQTVAHAPEEGWTWQLGDGEALARAVNRPVVWDFRTADVQAGGEGAPLAPFFHWALARHMGLREPVAFLNIGGVANVTWVDPSAQSPDAVGALLAFDTGPGNALLNDWMMRHVGAPMDRDGAAAAAGEPDLRIVHGDAAMNAFLNRRAPKSLDRNAFLNILGKIDGMSVEDGAATLTTLTVESIAESLSQMPVPPHRWLVCGGGRRNPVMMDMLARRINAPVEPVETAGFDGDMLEAQAFAYLAVRVARGLPTSAPGTTGCDEPIGGGRIAFPK